MGKIADNQYFIFLFVVFTIQLKSQCIPTYTPNTVFYPNTVIDYTNTSTFLECLYLCGINTIVYDTAHPTCRTVFVNSGCTYVSNSVGCPFTDIIYVKDNATLIIKANANSGSFRIFHEPFATIINLTSGAGTQVFTCTAIGFPTVNCSTADLSELINKNERVKIFPNPTIESLNIMCETITNYESYKIEIYNNLGQLIKEEELTFKNQTATINTKDLQSGVYFLNLKSPTLIPISKRFIVVR